MEAELFQTPFKACQLSRGHNGRPGCAFALAKSMLHVKQRESVDNQLSISWESKHDLEPVCPLFWGLNPPKEGLLQPKQGSFGFQVYIYQYFFRFNYQYLSTSYAPWTINSQSMNGLNLMDISISFHGSVYIHPSALVWVQHLLSWKLTYPRPKGMFEDDCPFPVCVCWDMLLLRRVSTSCA